jgi:cysteine desulfurase family protein
MKKINFDNGSTSFPKAPGLGKAIGEFLETGAYNINRGNYANAYEIQGLVYQTRGVLAELLGCKNQKHVVFTPGITYSLNFFIHGFLKKGDHIIVSALEHHAVMRPLAEQAKRGVEIDSIPSDEEGNPDLNAVETLLRPNTKAILVTHASNVCGTVLPIRELGELCRRHGLIFAVDSAQTAGILPISTEADNIDFLAFTGHKGLLGPQGIGGFVISEKLREKMEPVIMGGTGSKSDEFTMPQFLPDRYESGTLNLPGIVGLNHSLQYIRSVGITTLFEKEKDLTGRFLDHIINGIPQAKIIGKKDCFNRIAVVSLDFPGNDNACISFLLDERYGIQTRVGLHCAAAAHRALGTFPKGTVRFSFGSFNTAEEIDFCISALHQIINNI